MDPPPNVSTSQKKRSAPHDGWYTPVSIHNVYSSKLEIAKEALCECDRTHSCNEQNALAVPTRLLDVGRHGTDKVKVIICSEELEPADTLSGAYAALSYCWGKSPALTSTKSNLAARKRGFALSDMPRTLRDAVRVTRDIGLRYLWIDALCIVQDCIEDWRRESEQMAEVYGNAYVTIFAFGARDGEGGLFPPAHRWLGERSLMSVDHWHFGLLQLHFEREPLNHRGWAFQEWHLSTRKLMFTSYDVIFNCLYSHLQDRGKLYTQKLTPAAVLGHKDWGSMVSNYSIRELTNPSDKLPAMAGLARRFDTLSGFRNGRYLFGLWERYLPCALLWRRQSSRGSLRGPSLATPTTYRAPSWSWASINGPVSYAHFVWGPQKSDYDIVTDHIVFVATESPDEMCDYDVMARTTVVELGSHSAMDSDPLGTTVHRLRICSLMKSLERDSWIEESAKSYATQYDEYFTNLRLPSPKDRYNTQAVVNLSGDQVMRPFLEDLTALKFCAICRVGKFGRIWGLLLVEIDDATFRRIGCGWCDIEWFEDAVEADVEII